MLRPGFELASESCISLRSLIQDTLPTELPRMRVSLTLLKLLIPFEGLWKRCDFFLGQSEPECQHHNEFLVESGNEDGHEFLRAEAAFVVIVIGMIFMAVAFSLYSLVHPRYMFKRLSGYLHIITSGTWNNRTLNVEYYCKLVLLHSLASEMSYLKLHRSNGPTYPQVKAWEMEDMKETKLGLETFDVSVWCCLGSFALW